MLYPLSYARSITKWLFYSIIEGYSRSSRCCCVLSHFVLFIAVIPLQRETTRVEDTVVGCPNCTERC